MERAELRKLVLATGCAAEHGDTIFLCDPHWSTAEKESFAQLTQNSKPQTPNSKPSALASTGWLCIRTGGSSGGLKFARHDENTLAAAVRGFCAHFGLPRVNAVDVLPPWHVSGLMSRVRCAATGGTHLPWDWKKLEAGDFPSLPREGEDGAPPSSWVLSLVPTQLQRLLAVPAAVEWLRQFQIIFLGGGPSWPELTDAAARTHLPISLSYGLTETAAMIAALRPAEFLAGARSSGSALPHAHIHLTLEGRIAVSSASICHGYFPSAQPNPACPEPVEREQAQRVERAPPASFHLISEIRPAVSPLAPETAFHLIGEKGAEPVREFVTDDLGRIDEHGHLHVLGRADAIIITGGKKVNPAEVEAALRASGEFTDIAVLGLPDPEWGEIVVACHPTSPRPPDLAKAVAALAPHQRPKRFMPIAHWPRNAQGKLNRDQLLRDLL